MKLYEPGDEDLKAAAAARAEFERLARDPAWVKRLNEPDADTDTLAAVLEPLKSLAERMGAADSAAGKSGAGDSTPRLVCCVR